MNTRQRLVVQSAFLGSFLLSLFGILVVPAKATVRTVAVSVNHKSDVDKDGLNTSVPTLEVPTEMGTCRLSAAFPAKVTEWCDLITKFAAEHNLPADLIAAIVWLESGGDPRAYSHSGAVGLMQVMPRNGLAAEFQCVNGPCFADRPTIRELQDPEFNIAYGVRMLAELIDQFGGIRGALRAYGPMDVGFSYADQVIHLWESAY